MFCVFTKVFPRVSSVPSSIRHNLQRYISFRGGAQGHRVYIAVGSNLGYRFDNIVRGIDLLCESCSEVMLVRTSTLLETPPMYVSNQPAFLNGVVEIETCLQPKDLLKRIKDIERKLGRDFNGIRNGPRPLDLDIIMYGVENERSIEINDDDELQIPHPRLAEREFVLAPLIDLGASHILHPVFNRTIDSLYKDLQKSTTLEAIPVLPLPRNRRIYFNETIIMGILNVTPDSFSDGGNFLGNVDMAVNQALSMVADGAGIIDVGGESTRPGAMEVAIEEELNRVIPVIKGIRNRSDIPISIDTRHSQVAKAAVDAGADIVNDVSGGTFDPKMLKTVSQMGVPIILMHMRGTPETMQSFTQYSNIVDEVATELRSRSEQAQCAGIHRWHQVLDPGIGFAKDLEGNLKLLKHYGELQAKLNNIPLLLGTSRKGFIGKLTGEKVASERDFGTVASCVAAICLGGGTSRFNILRVHNVKGVKQGTVIMDAIRGANLE